MRMRFRCWWCRRLLGQKRLHHETRAGDRVRRCCNDCYHDLDSNYRRVYTSQVEEERQVRSYSESGEGPTPA